MPLLKYQSLWTNIDLLVGKLRKQLIVDLSVAFGLGITGGYAFWFGYHIPAVRKRDAYYAKLEAEGTGMCFSPLSSKERVLLPIANVNRWLWTDVSNFAEAAFGSSVDG